MRLWGRVCVSLQVRARVRVRACGGACEGAHVNVCA